jgi:hypothetical protein
MNPRRRWLMIVVGLTTACLAGGALAVQIVNQEPGRDASPPSAAEQAALDRVPQTVPRAPTPAERAEAKARFEASPPTPDVSIQVGGRSYQVPRSIPDRVNLATLEMVYDGGADNLGVYFVGQSRTTPGDVCTLTLLRSGDARAFFGCDSLADAKAKGGWLMSHPDDSGGTTRSGILLLPPGDHVVRAVGGGKDLKAGATTDRAVVFQGLSATDEVTVTTTDSGEKVHRLPPPK